jgi:glycosyltransferase involved in cell wall biosynthesis
MTRVLVDALGWPGRPRGVGRYIRELVAHLGVAGEVEVVLATGPWHLGFYAPLTQSGVRIVQVDGIGGSRLSRHAWHAMGLPTVARRVAADLVHVPEVVPAGRAAGIPMVVTIHDVAERDYPDVHGPFQVRYRRLVLKRLLRTSAHLITPSHFTAVRLAAFQPGAEGKTTVIPHGPGLDRTTETRKPALNLPDRFVLYVGALQRHKNVPRIVRSLRAVHASGVRRLDDLGLVLAGPSHNDTAEVTRAIGGDARVVWLELPSDGELAWLYRHAAGLVVPSLYEGFCLPITEAMNFGCPVITADRGGPREVAGNAAVLVDPLDEDAIAAAMIQVLTDEDLRTHLSAAGRAHAADFSWAKSATETAAVYRRAAAGEP